MNRFASVRFRLTAWYVLCLTLILSVFGAGARVAIKRSILAAVDHSLRTRLEDVYDFVDSQTRHNPSHLQHELDEEVQMGLGGGLVELWDDSGNLLFRSERLGRELPRQFPAPQLSAGQAAFSTLGSGRAASNRIMVNGLSFLVRVWEPMHEFDETLEHFDQVLLLSAVPLLLAACIGGFWVSGRALAPVDRITRDARSIGIANLAQRVEVPRASDELQRLAVTLNDMLGRIEGEVERVVQFTTDASHELRAPLTLIHTAADYSLRGERSREELLDAIQRILRESGRMTHLVNDLLLLARGDSSSSEADFTLLDLSPVAASAAESVRALAAAKGLKLSVRAPQSPLLVRGDEPSLSRLLLILLDNAIKYTEAGEVSISIEGREVLVSDTGIGLIAEDLPHIWDRFWRADKVRSRSAGGAGLGLSIARRIADRHGAALEVRSEIGKGSQFLVRFPQV